MVYNKGKFEGKKRIKLNTSKRDKELSFHAKGSSKNLIFTQ